jgi:hypothetical protein
MKKLVHRAVAIANYSRIIVRKNLLLFLMIALIPVQLNAGGFSINIGVNHSWLVYPNSSLPFENQFRPSYSIGVNSIQQVLQDVELSIGLRLFNIGRYNSFESGMSDYDVTISHIYISLPIRVGYQIVENVYPFVDVETGVQLHSGSKLTTSTGLNEEKTFTDEMNRLNIFAGFGLKYLFRIDQHQFGISGQYNFGLLRVSKDEQFDITETGSHGWIDWRTREVVMHVEYYFDI